MFVVWVVFVVWGLCCFLFEEKKGSGKVNLLLPLTISIFIGFVLGCFCLLGLEMFSDKNSEKSGERQNLLLLFACGRYVFLGELQKAKSLQIVTLHKL
jgi:hypothetical protein